MSDDDSRTGTVNKRFISNTHTRTHTPEHQRHRDADSKEVCQCLGVLRHLNRPAQAPHDVFVIKAVCMGRGRRSAKMGMQARAAEERKGPHLSIANSSRA